MSVIQHRELSARGGFALIVALMLMGLMVVLLLSLSSLTQVDLRTAQSYELSEKARLNALLGLQIALGQLQGFAGPDQRVTASAQLGQGRTGGGADGLGPPTEGTRHWTGVWGNANAWTSTEGQPVLLNWLVSGNEREWVQIDSGAGSFGRIDGGVRAPDFVPDGTAPTIGDGTTVRTDLKAEGRTWVLLVGSGTVGSDATRYVTAPLVDIDGTDGGSYGWWVGDAGVKADIGLVDPIANRSKAVERSYSFIMAQRAAGEEALADYPANAAELQAALSADELVFAAPAGTRSAMTGQLRERYHEVGVNTASVFADTLRGGLRKDLSAWLQQGGGPADNDAIIPGTDDNDFMPQWGIIRSYDAQRKSDVAQPARRQTRSDQGLSPVITFFSMGYGMSVTASGTLGVNLFPVLVLWNPTNVPIKDEFEVMFAIRNNAITTFRIDGDDARKQIFRLREGALDGDPLATPYRYYRFKVEETEIPAGASYVFTLQEPDEIYQAGHNVLIHGGDVTESVVLDTGLAIGIDETGGYEPVQWTQSQSWNSANPDVILRKAPENTDDESGLTGLDAFDAIQNRADVLHAVQYIGYFKEPTAVFSLRPGVPEPLMQHKIQMDMGSPANTAYLRWLANLNPRAQRSHRTALDGGQSPLYTSIFSKDDNSKTLPNFKDDKYASAGLSVSYTSGGYGDSVNLVLYGMQPVDVPLFSIAQLQHANLALLSIFPGYAVGNSLPSPHIGREDTQANITLRGNNYPMYDLSWHLNRELWDRYFFSTIPASLSQTDLDAASYQLPNARVEFTGSATVSDFKTTTAVDRNAGRLMLRGGFNINSTSAEAWRALLGATNGVAYDPANPGDTEASLKYPFSRLTEPEGGVGGSWSANDPWAGYRTLSEELIRHLADKIVAIVKAHGPFLSIADFVNRVPGDTSEDDRNFGGVLQRALNAVDTDESIPATARINMRTPFSGSLVSDATRPSGIDEKDSWGGATKKAPYASGTAFAPGYLTQADILTAIGPVLTARSDTFTIRSYGDAKNPTTGSVEARAWCEAIVQRLPEYYNTTEDAHVFPPANRENQDMGRRFKVLSFRWLEPDEV